MNHELGFYDYLANVRILGYEPAGFSVVTGSYDVSGWQNSMAIIVNKENPISRISMSQLDGVFGSQRAGGWLGTSWKPEFARGPEGNIRHWGQLGLEDNWTNQEINTYGYSLRYATALDFSNRVLHASDKWNENLLAFGSYVSLEGVRSLQADQIMERIENDPYGIAYIRWQSQFDGRVKVLSLAEQNGGPYYEFTVENLQSRKYPLWGDQSFWVNVKPGARMDPKTAEFVRFVLSREGQELVMEDGKYLPLSAEISKDQLSRLESLE
jgi:phosphate transport system substrate-binding protein